MTSKPQISIISPVYGGEHTVEELVRRIIDVMGRLQLTFEIVLVDDCGPDKSWEKISVMCSDNQQIRGLRLSRNFGQHFAITAGIDQARGEIIAVMDCDLQDDPEYLPAMVERIKEGYDIVYTVKKARRHSWFKNITAVIFNTVFNYLIDNKAVRANKNIGAYSMMTAKVAEAFRKYNDYHRHYLMVLRWLGFSFCYLEIEHKERFAGKSSYNFRKLMKHALDGITSQSDKLLRIFVTIGLAISGLSFLTILIIVVLYFTHGFLSGWASTMVLMLFSTGIILTGIGVLGIYIGKTFEQTKNRPKYIIDKVLN